MRRPVRDAAGALAAMVDDAVDAGYTGLRVTGQLSSGAAPVGRAEPGRLRRHHRHRARRAPGPGAVLLRPPPLPRRDDRADARAAPRRDRGDRRSTTTACCASPGWPRSACGWPARWTTATGPSSRGWSPTTLDDALRSDSAPAALELDLSSLRFLDVAGAVGLVHAAEEFPEAHRLVADRRAAGRAAGARPVRRPVRRAARRLRAPGVSQGFRCPGATGSRGARIPPKAPGARAR